jgi:PAS domain S-box-containing protein
MGRTDKSMDDLQKELDELRDVNRVIGQKMNRLKLLYSTINQINAVIARGRDRAELFRSICDVTVRDGKFSLAWIGLLDEDKGTVKAVAASGPGIDPDAHEDLTFLSIDQTVLSQSGHLSNEERNRIFAENLNRFGYFSSAAVPLEVSGKIIGIFSISAADPGYFMEGDERILIDEVGSNISFALEMLERDRMRIQWANAFEHCATGMAIGIPGSNTILTCNTQFAKLQGRTVSEIKDIPILSMYETSERDFVLKSIKEADEAGSKRYETRMVRKDGSVYPVQIDVISVKDESGTVIYRVATMQDLTERFSARAALQEAGERFTQIAAQSHTVLWEVDNEGLYTYIGPMAEKVWGYKPEELVGKKHYYDLHPENGRNEFRKATLEVFSRMESFFNMVNPIVSAKGKLLWMSTNGIPVKDRNNSLTGYRGADNDISALKNAEAALRQSEADLINAQEIAGMGSWELELEKNLTKWSKNLYRIYGYSEDTQPSYDKFLGLVHPEDKSILEEMSVALEVTKMPLSRDIRIVRPDGKILWINNSVVPVYRNNLMISLKGVNIDITSKKEADELILKQKNRLNAIINSIPDIFFVVDSKGNFLEYYCSRPEILIMPEDQVIGANIQNVFGPADSQLHMSKVHEALTLNQLITYEYSLIQGSSVTYWEARIGPIETDTVTIVIRNITKRREAEAKVKELYANLELRIRERTEQLETLNMNLRTEIEERNKAEINMAIAQKEAEDANRAKSVFLASMSHEIRTPMNAILGYAELLGSLIGGQPQTEYLASIKSSGRTLLTLINDILDLSKIEAGKMELEYEFVSMYSYFSDFSKIFEFKVLEKGLELVTNIGAKTPESICFDSVRLRQVILNLISNALRFTDKGKISLNVMADNFRDFSNSARDEKGTCDLVIEVEDTGIGIDSEFHKAIFGSFFQIRGRTSRGGTGLGLAISQRLIEMMNGSIDVTSQAGAGTKFTVRVPDLKYDRNPDKLFGQNTIEPDDIVFEKATILIVDDIYDNRRYLIDALSRSGFSVFEAEDGPAALDFLDKIQPDLIISDIRMPVMTGFELLEKIHADEKLKHIPVIAYSASVMKEQREKIKHSLFAGLLIKPVQVADLLAELMRHLPYELKQPVVNNLPHPSENKEIADHSELIAELEGQYYQTWQSFGVRQPIRQIMAFGKDLKDLGVRHNCSTIARFGENLLNAAYGFNIESILKLLTQYPDIISGLKNGEDGREN